MSRGVTPGGRLFENVAIARVSRQRQTGDSCLLGIKLCHPFWPASAFPYAAVTPDLERGSGITVRLAGGFPQADVGVEVAQHLNRGSAALA